MPEFKPGDRVRVTSIGSDSVAGKVISLDPGSYRVEFTHAPGWVGEVLGPQWEFADTALEHID